MEPSKAATKIQALIRGSQLRQAGSMRALTQKAPSSALEWWEENFKGDQVTAEEFELQFLNLLKDLPQAQRAAHRISQNIFGCWLPTITVDEKDTSVISKDSFKRTIHLFGAWEGLPARLYSNFCSDYDPAPIEFFHGLLEREEVERKLYPNSGYFCFRVSSTKFDKLVFSASAEGPKRHFIHQILVWDDEKASWRVDAVSRQGKSVAYYPSLSKFLDGIQHCSKPLMAHSKYESLGVRD